VDLCYQINMNYSLYIIKGGKLDGRVYIVNNDTHYKILLATPTLKAKVGIRLLSYESYLAHMEAYGVSEVVVTPTNFIEQRKLIPHLINRLKCLNIK